MRVYSACLVALGLVSVGPLAEASNDPDAELFSKATNELGRGAFSQAIIDFEQLSDRGFIHPDASYNRALAYLQRAESAKSKPGDLGQAAAGLREAALLRRGDPDAEALLSNVRQEVSRLRARQGQDPVVVRPPLGRALTGLLPENVWASLAALGALALSVGLVLRTSQQAQRRLSGWITGYSGAAILVIFGAMAWSARQYRVGSQEAVVITDEARLLNENGSLLKAKALDVEASAVPQGASVFVERQRGRLLQVRWGSLQAWIKASELRRLGPPLDLSSQF